MTGSGYVGNSPSYAAHLVSDLWTCSCVESLWLLGILPFCPQRMLITLDPKSSLILTFACQVGCRDVMDISQPFFSAVSWAFFFMLHFLCFDLLVVTPTLACSTALFGDPAVMHPPNTSCLAMLVAEGFAFLPAT